MIREFFLPEEDDCFLADYGLDWHAILDGSRWVLLERFAVPPGYNHAAVTAAIRIETGYPLAALDMVYFHPALARADGKPIGAADNWQQIRGIQYQRWSRHYTQQNPWIIGQHRLEDHVHAIENWLAREFHK